MKKISFLLPGILYTTLIFSQAQITRPVLSGKIQLANGQKIVVESSLTLEASLSPGMDLTNSSTSENTLEVKNSTNKNYTISTTLTKLKVNMNMMGQPTNYDSEKKEEPASDMEKALAEKLNKPVDIIIDNTTGMAIMEKKKEMNGEDPTEGLLNMFADNSDDAVVSGAFELVPAGKMIGDNWSDSTFSKEIKTIRSYTLKSITNNESVIQLDVVSNAVNKVDVQGMEIEFKSTTKTTGEIITDNTTGLVKKRTAQSDITGSFQLMGQDVPISAKANSITTYK